MSRRKTLTELLAFDGQRAERKAKRSLDELRASLKAAHEVIDRLEREKDVLLGLDDKDALASWQQPKSVTKGEATGIALWSDWHTEQIIRKEETNGLNSWNPALCEAAVKNLCERTSRVILPRYRLAAKIDVLVVWLGGDFIEGHLRAENLVHNALSPIKAVQFAESLLERALREIASHSGAKQIVVVTSTGNHDRTTEKTWASGRNDTSYATLMYDHLRKIFKNHPKITWQAEEGEMTYLDVYDYKLRFVHGDSVKYHGGVGGLSIPANKQVKKWNDGIYADYTLFGDKHTFHWDAPGGWVCNGCLSGPAAYSLRYGVTESCQAFAVVDRKRGLTDATRVFCR